MGNNIMVYIMYDRAFDDNIMDALGELGIRQYSKLKDTLGAGTHEPHLGDAVWPGLNNTLIAVIEEEKKDELFKTIRSLQQAHPIIALRAFALPVIDQV